MKRLMVISTGAAVAVGLGWVGAEGDRTCQTRSNAQVCMVERGNGSRIDAKGFMPEEELQVMVGGEAPFPAPTDAKGRSPGATGAVAGVLLGKETGAGEGAGPRLLGGRRGVRSDGVRPGGEKEDARC